MILVAISVTVKGAAERRDSDAAQERSDWAVICNRLFGIALHINHSGKTAFQPLSNTISQTATTESASSSLVGGISLTITDSLCGLFKLCKIG